MLIGKKVVIEMRLEAYQYKGVVTGVSDEFIILDNNIYVARKYILAIEVK